VAGVEEMLWLHAEGPIVILYGIKL